MFPMNQNAEDMMMNAPSTVRPERLRELHIRVVEPPAKKPTDVVFTYEGLCTAL